MFPCSTMPQAAKGDCGFCRQVCRHAFPLKACPKLILLGEFVTTWYVVCETLYV